MKKTILTSMAMAFLLLTVTIGKSQSTLDKWPELKSFHTVMSQTFHPVEEGNFKPIRERSGEMVEKAKKLSASTIPAEFNIPDVQQAVKDLESGSKKLDEMIKKKASDEEVKKSLSALHDVFHIIVEKCMPGDEKGHDDHKAHDQK